jgi:spore coat protein H
MKKLIGLFMIIMFMFILIGCDYELAPKKTETIDNSKIDKINIESFDRLFDDSIKKSITIQITRLELNRLDQVMKDYYQEFNNYKTDEYAKANMVYEDENGTIEVLDVGFRTRGNLSRTRIQNNDLSLNLSHFKISFNRDYDILNKNRTVFELDEIDLKYNRNYDSTYLTEKFSLDLFNKYQVFAAKTTLANFYLVIGGVKHFYGVYTIFEPIDKNFVQRRLDSSLTDGNLYKSLWQNYGPANLYLIDNPLKVGIKDESTNYRPAYDLKTNKRVNDTTDLLNFIELLNSLNQEYFEIFIEENFDVSMFLRYLAINVLLGNPDDYRAMGNNYYLYNQSTSNIWQMIPYDYDHGLGQGWNPFNNYSIGNDIYQWVNLNAELLNLEDYPHPLSDKILKIEKYQLEYESYLKELINPDNDYFNYTSFLNLYNQQKELYDTDELDLAMQNQRFSLRNVMWYFNEKISDINQQLEYYSLNPNQRNS